MSSYIVMPTAEAAAEWSAFFRAPEAGLTANGHRVRAEGARVVFSDGAIAYLRSHCGPADDGYLSEEAGRLTLWLGGDPYEVRRES